MILGRNISSLRGAIATKQSSSSWQVMDCFASLAMTKAILH
jgi:hypothetical protein